MTKERASGGVKLSSITIVGLGELAPAEGIFELREHVTRVDYRVDNAPPDWDDLPSGETEYVWGVVWHLSLKVIPSGTF